MKLIHLMLPAAIIFLSGCATTSTKPIDEEYHDLNLTDASFNQLLRYYEKVSGIEIEIIQGLSAPPITIQTNRITMAQQKNLIEQRLAEENIGFFNIVEGRVVAAWLTPETDPARKYLNYCRAKKVTVSLGKFGWIEVKDYWSRVPELQQLRDGFDRADDELMEILMQDDEFRQAMEEYRSPGGGNHQTKTVRLTSTKMQVYKRLETESEAYRRAREKRDEALFVGNTRTLEYIIDDYEAQGKEFPIDWIPRY